MSQGLYIIAYINIKLELFIEFIKINQIRVNFYITKLLFSIDSDLWRSSVNSNIKKLKPWIWLSLLSNFTVYFYNPPINIIFAQD